MTSTVWEFLKRPSDFGDPGARAVSAFGTRITFADGKEAICGTSGLWNVNLGYGNKVIADAVHTALLDHSYLTLFRYGHVPADQATRALLDAAGSSLYGRVIFSTSGSAANDVVLKLVRQHAVLGGERDRRLAVGLWPSYHGATFGSSALTGEELLQSMYGADRRLIRHLPHNDGEAMSAFMNRHGDQVAAVVVEPLAGSGALPLSMEYLESLADLRARHGFLLVVDEVATGFHRTGPLFAHQQWPLKPDVMVTSKGLTNGTCAAAAVLVSHAVCRRFDEADAPFLHGETQAGTPPTCAAIVATLDEARRLRAADRAQALSEALATRLADLADRHPLVVGHTGAGCFRAARLAWPDGTPFFPHDVMRAVDVIRSAGAIVHPGPGCVQLIPALTYEDEDVDTLFDRVRLGLDRMRTL